MQKLNGHKDRGTFLWAQNLKAGRKKTKLFELSSEKLSGRRVPEAGSHGGEADDEEEEDEEEEEDAGDGVHDGGSGGIGDWLEKIISCYLNHDVDM